MTFKEYINEEKINEGIFDKLQNFLIKNVNLIKKAYINHDKKYGRENAEKANIKLTKNEKGISYFVISNKGKEKLGLVINGDENHSKYLENGDGKYTIMTSKLSELEQNGITPVYIAFKEFLEK